jgi:uncharacterized protein with HEPN domain
MNVTVLGEAAGQLSTDVKDKFPDMPWQQPIRLRNRIVHGYWSIDLKSSTPPPPINYPHLQLTCAPF